MKERNSLETVDISEKQSNDHWPYFVCPACGMDNITRPFRRCIDCGVRLNWVKQTIAKNGDKNNV